MALIRQESLVYDHPEPKAREDKPGFEALPPALLADIETVIGSKIIKSRMAWGGFSPAFSVCVETNNGGSFFIKGTHPEQTAHGAKMLEQEISLYKNVTALCDIAPAFHGTVALGGEDDWYLGIWEAIPGAHIIRDWDESRFDAVIMRLKQLYDHDLSKGDRSFIADMTETNFIKDIVSGEMSWQKFADNPDRQTNFANMFVDPDAGRNWLLQNSEALIGLSATPARDHHHALLHFDMRADNIVFDATGRAWIIDWPNGCYGPIGYDVIALCCNMMADCGLPAWACLQHFESTTGFHLPQRDIDIILAQTSGYYALQAYRPVPEKLPRLRWLQKSLLFAALGWLEQREITSTLPQIAAV